MRARRRADESVAPCLSSDFSICLSSACGSEPNGTSRGVVGSQQATHFSIAAPAAASAGTAFHLTATALDATNHTSINYSGTVHFTCSDSHAVLPADSTLTDGAGTFPATLNTSGNQSITVTDTVKPAITGVSNEVQVSSTGAAGTFSRTGSMVFSRVGHTATLLKDGTVLIAGGENEAGPLASAKIFDPSTKTFRATAGSMRNSRVGHTATLLNDGTVLIAGGFDATGALASAAAWSPRRTLCFFNSITQVSPETAICLFLELPTRRPSSLGGKSSLREAP